MQAVDAVRMEGGRLAQLYRLHVGEAFRLAYLHLSDVRVRWAGPPERAAAFGCEEPVSAGQPIPANIGQN